MLNRRRHSGESGQTIVLALAFLAVFALVAVSVVNLARAVESQNTSAQHTAAIDSVAEGAGQFAMADAGSQPCSGSTGGSGTMNFPSTIRSDTLTYTFPAGSSGGCTGSTSSGNAGGSSCQLCVLNSAATAGGQAYSPAYQAINTSIGLTVAGEIDSNGSISGTVKSTGSSAKIGVLSGATCGSCTPAKTTLATPFHDPLAGVLPIPSNPGSQQTYGGGVIHPGVYSSIDSNGTTYMSAGVYTVTGGINLAGNGGLLTNTDVSAGSTTDSDAQAKTDADSQKTSVSGGPTDTGTGAPVTFTSNTLKDTSKAWTTNQWAGATVAVVTNAKKGTTVTGTVQSNTPTVLTLTAVWSKTPTAGNSYTVSKVTYTSTTLVDSSKTWTVNQWAGSLVEVTLSDGTLETAKIASNTATTLTVPTWSSTPTLGNTYVISTIVYTSTTLADGSKNWTANQWKGSLVTVTLPSSITETNTVASNTANTLTMSAAWTTTPPAGNAYSMTSLHYTSTTIVDGTKNWTNNQWQGSLVTVTLSNNSIENAIVASNTANTLTVSPAWTTQPASGNGYVVTTLGYTTNTLVDANKSWITNQWTGSIVTVTLTGGATETGTVASNTATTLTMTAPWSTLPAAGNAYSLLAPVVIYLACPTTAPYWSCATAGQSGGNVNISGQASLAVTASPSGPYAGVALFTDPNLIDPSGGNVISISGNGGGSIFGGTLYLPRGSINLTGGGSSGSGLTVGGRLIVRALFLGGNGNSALAFSGSAPLPTSTCYYYNDALTGAEPNSTGVPAHLQFETGCGSAGLTGGTTLSPTSIINFAYGP
jgi:hypothetical protein